MMSKTTNPNSYRIITLGLTLLNHDHIENQTGSPSRKRYSSIECNLITRNRALLFCHFNSAFNLTLLLQRELSAQRNNKFATPKILLLRMYWHGFTRNILHLPIPMSHSSSQMPNKIATLTEQSTTMAALAINTAKNRTSKMPYVIRQTSKLFMTQGTLTGQ